MRDSGAIIILRLLHQLAKFDELLSLRRSIFRYHDVVKPVNSVPPLTDNAIGSTRRGYVIVFAELSALLPSAGFCKTVLTFGST